MSTDTAWAPTQHDRAALESVIDARPALAAGSVTLRGVSEANLAAGSGDTIVGVALVKPGMFNGYFEVNRENLDAWVSRFGELYPDTFEPPMRLNHSWDIESVIGWFTELRVEVRPDKSAGGADVPMLVGDLRLVGTPAENAQIKAWIKSGKLSKVSSEFWPYHTNAGVEYPSVFAGAAFVDIPAAEGLGAIALRRATLSSSTTPTPEEPPVSTTTPPVEPTEPVVEPTDPPEPVVETPPAVDDAPVIGDEPVVEPEEEEPATGDLAAVLAGQGVQLSAAQAQAVEAEITRRAALRREIDGNVERFRVKGVVPLKVADNVNALLRHDDPEVRDNIVALLEVAKPPVALRETPGIAGNAPTNADGTLSPAELRELAPEEFGPQWAVLTTDQRKDAAYLAAYDHVIVAPRRDAQR